MLLSENDLKKEIKTLKSTIGKLHAEACSHRMKKDLDSMRQVHMLIERRHAEIKECEYLMEWVEIKHSDLVALLE